MKEEIDSSGLEAVKYCPACGFPVLPDADRCPRCRVSRKEGKTFWREFWVSLIVSALIMAVSALIVFLIYAKSTHS
jgi:rubredoxin